MDSEDDYPILDVELHKNHMITVFNGPRFGLLLNSHDFIIIQYLQKIMKKMRQLTLLINVFFGNSMFSDMIVILAKRGFYYVCNQHDSSPLSVIEKYTTEAIGFKPEIHVKENDDDGAQILERIMKKLGKITNIGIVSTSKKYHDSDARWDYQSPVFSKWLQKQGSLRVSIITDEVLNSLEG
ncbi:hypothetical protein MKW98_000558 [Papaver atlanticum]|uniref:Uncharacterized protein n=1 Tax=Papaver atlanticum TaxID=357466 RepID=A0AAD4S4R2_9MAGN|nr:hypothetical protein MKW98_000558 [Papaver atlanticum]